ncbi:hypothetical protein D3C77_501160 [compost metagenome]
MLLQQIGNQAGQTEDAGEDTGQQSYQKPGVGDFPGLAHTATQQRTQRPGKRRDGTQQFVIDASNERDSPAGYARHHIRRTHRHALGVQQQSVFHASFH